MTDWPWNQEEETLNLAWDRLMEQVNDERYHQVMTQIPPSLATWLFDLAITAYREAQEATP